VAELGLSLVLVVGAALMVRSFALRFAADPGVDTRNVLTARVALAGEAYADPTARASFLEELVRRLRDQPGIAEAGLSSGLPFQDPVNDGRSFRSFEIEGQPVEVDRRPVAAYAPATAGYFQSIRLLPVAGRLFNEEEEDEGRAVVLVSEGLAARFQTGGASGATTSPIDAQGAVGRRLRLEGGEWLEIVGVVKEPREGADMLWIADSSAGQVYVPYRRDPLARATLVARTRSLPEAQAAALRETLRGLDPSLPLHSVFTLQEVQARSMWLSALWGRMLAAVALFGLVLAALGVYGVVSYAVSQRTHEMGVRMALGAKPGDVLRLVLGQGVRLALFAVPAGLLGAFALSGALSGLLHGVEATDPPTLLGAAFLLTLVALLASYAPARRATRVDPLVALRTE
jgi:putative ABC transport system permease protein